MNILTLDIETAPSEVYAWQMWKTNIAPNQIITPGGMMTYAAKWYGKKQVVYKTWEDEDFYETLHDMMNEADLIVGYNHEKFDLRYINAEFVQRGFFPTRPVPTIDLFKVVKKHFHFPHYRLDYVAQRLLGKSKIDTGGFELWPAFIAGEPQARRLMKRYNRADTCLTEELYDRLLPWIFNHPFMGDGHVIIEDTLIDYQCPACNSYEVKRERPRRTRCYAIRVVHCQACGSWFDGKRKKL